MKAVLISIAPKWCKLIANGEKTVEIRKTRPKMDTPFKCYIYETKAVYAVSHKGAMTKYGIGCGKVIGEFVCDNITQLFGVCNHDWEYLQGDGHDYEKRLVVKEGCLTENEFREYVKHRPYCYAWHISDLKIYDTPEKLSEFCPPCDPAPGCFCDYCKTHGRYLTNMIIQRPPQSWRYVEELAI